MLSSIFLLFFAILGLKLSNLLIVSLLKVNNKRTIFFLNLNGYWCVFLFKLLKFLFVNCLQIYNNLLMLNFLLI